MSFREGEEDIREYIRGLEDRIRELEKTNKISARSWLIGENSVEDLQFIHKDGKIVTIGKTGPDTVI